MNRPNALLHRQNTISTAVYARKTDARMGWSSDQKTMKGFNDFRGFAVLHALWKRIFPQTKLSATQQLPIAKQDKPPVSCICLHNGAPKRLEEAIYSFLQQDYAGAKELVVLNDDPGQTLLFEHPEVRMINLTRRGRFRRETWNKAVNVCKHELIFVWSADDISLPHRISTSIDHISRVDNYTQFMPATTFIWENGRINGPYQNLFRHGGGWSRRLFKQVKGIKKIEHKTAVIAPELDTIAPQSCSSLAPEEVYYIFRGLNYVTGKPRTQSGVIELKPHWRKNYSKCVQDHLTSRVSPFINSSLPELPFGARKKLSRYGTLAARRYYVFEDRKLAYVSVAKVACTSIKSAMMQPYNIHKNVHNAWPDIFRGELLDKHQDFFTFSFVRNPFDRLVSGYRDKIILKSKRKEFGGIPTNISFAEFVAEVAKRPDCLINIHFQSQFPKLYKDGNLVVDYLGRFENLAEDWLHIAERFQFAHQLPHKMISSGRRGTHKDYRDYYTEPLVHLVYDRFRADIEAFGYERSYEELLAYVRTKE